jgi:hypothetical protein
MPIGIENNINSAILSGAFGLQSASNGITQAATNIVEQTTAPRDRLTLLSDAAIQQIDITRGSLPTGGDSLTDNLVSLQLNLTNAQASANVIDRVDETLGRFINEIV